MEVHPASASSIIDTCRQLDEGLTSTFRRGDIRLLRRAWLLEAPDRHVPYRQKLEEREGQGESPLLDPEEAVALLERGDRSIGALTQCAPPVPSRPSSASPRLPPLAHTDHPHPCSRTAVLGTPPAIRTRRASS